MALQDYANRKYDYLAFRNVAPRGDQRLGMLLYDDNDNGQICVGAQKLAQRWALEFLTEEGSMPGLPERGCGFMQRVRQGRLRTQADVIAAFNTSGIAVTRNLRNEEYDGMPADERFLSADLLSVAFLPGYAELHVMITSRAENTRSLILPISTLP